MQRWGEHVSYPDQNSHPEPSCCKATELTTKRGREKIADSKEYKLARWVLAFENPENWSSQFVFHLLTVTGHPHQCDLLSVFPIVVSLKAALHISVGKSV